MPLIVTREMVMSAERCTGLLRCYGSKEISSIYIVLTDDYVVCFDCESGKWSESSSDSYWDLYDSRVMMTVMTGWAPEEAIKTLEKMNAF